MIKNKRGLSMVIATVLILLLTIVIAAILAQIIIPFVRDNLRESTECVPYQNYVQFDSSFGYNCYAVNGANFDYKISVKAAASDKSVQDKVGGINFIFGDGGSSSLMTIKSGMAESCDVKKIKNLGSDCLSLGVLGIPKIGESISYVYKSSQKLTSIGVGTSLSSGRVCDVSDTIKNMQECKGT